MKNLTAGLKIGRWTLLFVRFRPYGHQGRKMKHWRVRRDCGQLGWVRPWNLSKGMTNSCGCLNTELTVARSKTHGLTLTKEHRIWSGMKDRCYNSKSPYYHNYGGRGIRVCFRWRDDFLQFLADMRFCPPECSLDRVDNDGDYAPANCRWATLGEQANNKRTNRVIQFQGQSLTVSRWARCLGMRSNALSLRLNKYGWSVERALTTPVKKIGAQA
jgi:hypothetical protein